MVGLQRLRKPPISLPGICVVSTVVCMGRRKRHGAAAMALIWHRSPNMVNCPLTWHPCPYMEAMPSDGIS